jgi:2-polyprenyl-3-methyl-5-hydroxy-6-metoxy-1,4-benzoquinol methylase
MDKSATASNRENFWANIIGTPRHKGARYHIGNHTDPGVIARRTWFAKIVAETAKSKNYKDVLEIGCNGGTNLWYIQKQNSNLNLHGIDINKDAIQFAQEELLLEHTKESSIYELKSLYKKKKFDVIYTMGVLIHVPLDMMVYTCASMLEQLKDNGQIYCVEFNASTNHATATHQRHAHKWVYNYKQLFTEAAETLNQPIAINIVQIPANCIAGSVKHLISVNKVPS